MKKILALLVIAGFVACNSAETPETKVDTPAVKTETPAPATTDTTAATTDTTKKAEAPAATPAK
ncbi:MAG: hypothetical protein H3C56_01765 [Chitinophagaceae bacterium]|nr:hypothetical protein [Chitinophagaceae bacterium]